MPLPISTTLQAGEDAVVSPLAQPTEQVQKEADVSKELKGLKSYLSAKNKGGILAIRTTSSGGKELYRMQWYHRLWFCRTGAAQQKAAADYVRDLFSKIKMPSEAAGNALGDYLSFSNSLTYKTVADVFKQATGLAPSGASTTATTFSTASISSTSSPRRSGQAGNSIESLLESQGVVINGKPINQGGQGLIYGITYQGNKDDYLYKKEKETMDPRPINDLNDVSFGGNKIHRISGDIAAARCRLPNTVESVGFFLKIVTNPGENQRTGLPEKMEYHYLPNESPEQIKRDAKELIEKYPGAEFFLHSQIMKKAAGKDLVALTREGELNTNPQSIAFKNIVYGIYSFLAAARLRNFVHRDIKPGNLVLDQATGRLTVIDPTSGRHLAKRDKAMARASNSLYARPTMIDDPRGSSASFVSRGTMDGASSAIFRSTTSPIIQATGKAGTQDQAEEIDFRPSEARPSNRGSMRGMEHTTPFFVPPGALADFENEKEYGAEFDSFSTAMTLLSLIHKDEFSVCQKNKFPTGYNDATYYAAAALAKDWGTDPTKYLEKYLSWIGGDKSETAKILNKEENLPLKNFLRLLFQASASGEAGEEAFAKLATNSYLLECKAVSPPPQVAA